MSTDFIYISYFQHLSILNFCFCFLNLSLSIFKANFHKKKICEDCYKVMANRIGIFILGNFVFVQDKRASETLWHNPVTSFTAIIVELSSQTDPLFPLKNLLKIQELRTAILWFLVRFENHVYCSWFANIFLMITFVHCRPNISGDPLNLIISMFHAFFN